jgi:HK97 family phage portal protein
VLISAILETRATLNKANPRDPVVADWWGGSSNTVAGSVVTPDSALRLTAVFAAIRLLSSSISSLPLITYNTTTDGKQPATSSTLFTVLKDKPNKWQTSAEWREMMACHFLLRGNAYSQIVRDGSGRVRELIPLHPDRVTPFIVNDTIAYKYVPAEGGEKTFLAHEIHHWRGMSLDGVEGVSPITWARETIGLSMAAEDFGGAYFGNGTVLSGVLEHPNKLGDTAYDRLKKSWADRHQGVTQSHKPAILEEGMTWKQLGVKPEEAQFLETRKFQVAEIARLYGVPPHMIGDVDGSTSWGTGIEQQSIGFVTYSLNPILVKIEQAMKRDLLNLSSQSNMFVKFNTNALMRGDSASRADYYNKMWGLGSMNSDEIRAFEDMNKIEGGDQYFIPLNHTGLNDPVEPEPEPEPEPEEDSRGFDLGPILEDMSERLASYHRRMTEKEKDIDPAFVGRILNPVYKTVKREFEITLGSDANDILDQIKKGLEDG